MQEIKFKSDFPGLCLEVIKGITPLYELTSTTGIPKGEKLAFLRQINEKSLPSGDTILMVAIQHKHPDLVKELLARGADLNIANAKGETPLMLAIEGGQKDIILTLLQHGADPNALNERYKNFLRVFFPKKSIAD